MQAQGFGAQGAIVATRLVCDKMAGQATANISAFNIANALGGIIGGTVIDSSFGAAAIPFAAIAVPLVGLAFIVSLELKRSPQNAQSISNN